jgi:hypothetical protein
MPRQAKTTKSSDGRQEQKAIQTVNIYGFEKKKPKTKRKTKKGAKKRVAQQPPIQPRMQAPGGFLGGPVFQAPTFFPPTYFPPKFTAPSFVPPTPEAVAAPQADNIRNVEQAINADLPNPDLAQDVAPAQVARREGILGRVGRGIVEGLMGLGRAADVIDELVEPLMPVEPIQPVVGEAAPLAPAPAQEEIVPAPAQEEIVPAPAQEEIVPAPAVPVIAEEAGEIVPYRERFAAGAGRTGTITLEPVPKAPKKVEVTIPERFKGMKVTKEDLQKIPTPLVKPPYEKPISLEEMRKKRLAIMDASKSEEAGPSEEVQEENVITVKTKGARGWKEEAKVYKEKIKNKTYTPLIVGQLSNMNDDEVRGIAKAFNLSLQGTPGKNKLIKRILSSQDSMFNKKKVTKKRR